jgi:hypothetical protein
MTIKLLLLRKMRMTMTMSRMSYDTDMGSCMWCFLAWFGLFLVSGLVSGGGSIVIFVYPIIVWMFGHNNGRL